MNIASFDGKEYHRMRQRMYQRAWHHRNRDRRLAEMKAYRAANREEINARRREQRRQQRREARQVTP